MELKKSWCRPGNHPCYATDLVVTFDTKYYGICRACIRSQTKEKGLKNYWQGDVDKSLTGSERG